MATLGLVASVARFARAVAFAGVAGAVTAALAQADVIKNVVVDIVAAIPILSVESEQGVAFIVVSGLTALLLGVDKELRDRGYYPNFLE